MTGPTCMICAKSDGGCLFCAPPPEPELWLPVVGYEDSYEVSDLGRVRSVPRVVMGSDGRTQTVRGGILKPSVKSRTGHLRVTLSGQHGQKVLSVHRLVLEAFVGPAPDGSQCCHWDDDPANNRIANLRWDTTSANSLDAVRNGRHPHARKTHCKYGHPFDEANTRITNRGRECRACVRERNAKYYKAAREENNQRGQSA